MLPLTLLIWGSPTGCRKKNLRINEKVHAWLVLLTVNLLFNFPFPLWPCSPTLSLSSRFVIVPFIYLACCPFSSAAFAKKASSKKKKRQCHLHTHTMAPAKGHHDSLFFSYSLFQHPSQSSNTLHSSGLEVLLAAVVALLPTTRLPRSPALKHAPLHFQPS